MKVIHIESGLGNQMLSFCEYIAMRIANPNDKFYIETIVYDISECSSVINQWNGYELEQIFGIQVANVRELFSDVEWKNIIDEIRSSQFWLHNWNWPVYFQKTFENAGLKLVNTRGDFEERGCPQMAFDINRKMKILDYFRHKDWFIYLKRKKNIRDHIKLAKVISNEHLLFNVSQDDELTGQQLTFKFINSGIERIEKEIRNTFVFPEIKDSRNRFEIGLINNSNSVAIHARRGDMLGDNYPLYRFGYFKKCVNFIRTRVKNPVFYIFCDPDSVLWVKQNVDIFGVNLINDKIRFVDWNKGNESFRDMQLMAACKHQIITESSFGWWGAWLNINPNKITCSPYETINTTHHF